MPTNSPELSSHEKSFRTEIIINITIGRNIYRKSGQIIQYNSKAILKLTIWEADRFITSSSLNYCKL